MTLNELREKYLKFFESKNHKIIPSSSLLPENDPTTLFTGSGMQPMVPFLLGETHPLGIRIVDSQKCFRAEDIEEVGDNRHTTFFEMLGNWSLGDYFKEEQITWMFEFLTKEVGLDPKNLYITVFAGNEDVPRDTEAVEIWKKCFKEVGIDAEDKDDAEEKGMQGGRIFYYDDKKNWWSRAGVPKNMPVGEPGGPDTEMFWDFGAELGYHENSEWKDEPCHVNCDCGRFMEIGNNVFMAYKRGENGFEELENKNVDFGGGLERIMAAKNNDPDVFKLDVFDQMRASIEKASGKIYGNDTEDTFAFRVILDHLRAATFLIGDGAVPSNKDQGYFTRRLLRRAIRFADKLGVKEQFCKKVALEVIDVYKEIYTNLDTQKDFIIDEIVREEEKFRKTLEKGLKEFDKKVGQAANGVISGNMAFELFATYGFPIEITEDLVKERDLKLDKKGFEKAFLEHQEVSRAGADQKFKGGLADHSEEVTRYHTATHLLHQALRDVLGDHVGQKGSNITKERMRFDFSHPEKMTDEEKKQVEEIVNKQIQEKLPISWEEMSVEEAKSQGAIGLFEERYGEKVKVYKMGDYSMEICGGPHVENTLELGVFKIKKEESCSRGVRRIKAVLS